MISRSTVHRVNNIKKTTAEVKDTFQEFDDAMQKKMKSCSEDGNIEEKHNPDNWADLIVNDNNFREEFEHIYNNDEIPEADDEDYTPDILDDTYLNMKVDFPRDGKGPKLAHAVKLLQDKDDISIGISNDCTAMCGNQIINICIIFLRFTHSKNLRFLT